MVMDVEARELKEGDELLIAFKVKKISPPTYSGIIRVEACQIEGKPLVLCFKDNETVLINS